jgi:hypothetical protein
METIVICKNCGKSIGDSEHAVRVMDEFYICGHCIDVMKAKEEEEDEE